MGKGIRVCKSEAGEANAAFVLIAALNVGLCALVLSSVSGGVEAVAAHISEELEMLSVFGAEEPCDAMQAGKLEIRR